MPDLSKRMFGRRTFVRLGVAAGGLGMLAACTPAPPPAPTAAPAASAAPTAAPAAANPTQAVQPATATQQIGAKSPMDVIYVRDQYHASWVESGFLQPLDETDEINALYADMFPYNANQMQWKGKKYGLPYYTDFDIFAYNEKMVSDAGFDKPPATLDELRKQAETMKQKGISDYPLAIDVSQGSDQMCDPAEGRAAMPSRSGASTWRPSRC